MFNYSWKGAFMIRRHTKIGEYILEDLCYYGKNSQVWKARRNKSERQYCIKLVKGYESESAILKKIRHNGIVMLYESFAWEDYQVLVMSYYEGETLGSYLKRGNVLSARQVYSIVVQLCEILGYLHAKRQPIFYLDLKESNIMLDKLGTIVLIDFGSAIEAGGIEQEELSGTSWYMPPEYRDQGAYGSYTDCFSLGRVIEKMTQQDKEHQKAWAEVVRGCTRISPMKRWNIEKIKEAAFKRSSYV